MLQPWTLAELALLLSNMFCDREIKLTILVVRTTIAMFVMTTYNAIKGQGDRSLCAQEQYAVTQSSVR